MSNLYSWLRYTSSPTRLIGCKVMNIFENMSTFVIQNQIIIEYDAESQHKIGMRRTLSLSLAGVILGVTLAADKTDVSQWTAALIFLTTVCLQILKSVQ